MSTVPFSASCRLSAWPRLSLCRVLVCGLVLLALGVFQVFCINLLGLCPLASSQLDILRITGLWCLSLRGVVPTLPLAVLPLLPYQPYLSLFRYQRLPSWEPLGLHDGHGPLCPCHLGA